MKYNDKDMMCICLTSDEIFKLIFEVNQEIQNLKDEGQIFVDVLNNEMYLTYLSFEKMMYYLDNDFIRAKIEGQVQQHLENSKNWA
jgi:hypothetical protein